MLVLGLSSTVAQAHEVAPTIADLTVAEGQADLTLSINLEAFLAGVDLDQIDDTNDAPQAADYDALRALSEEALAARAVELLEAWNALPLISVEGTPLVLRSANVDVPSDVGPELSRITEWGLTADVPQGSELVFSWPNGAGDIVLRQQGVAEPYTGLISGGSSSPAIALVGAMPKAVGRAL